MCSLKKKKKSNKTIIVLSKHNEVEPEKNLVSQQQSLLEKNNPEL